MPAELIVIDPLTFDDDRVEDDRFRLDITFANWRLEFTLHAELSAKGVEIVGEQIHFREPGESATPWVADRVERIVTSFKHDRSMWITSEAARIRRVRARQSDGQPNKLEPCGTRAAARRHERDAERYGPMCERCRQANRDHRNDIYHRP